MTAARASASAGDSSARRSHSASITAGIGDRVLTSLMGTEPIWPGRFLSVHLRFSRGVITIAVVVVVLAVAITFGLYQLLKRADPMVVPEAYCTVRTPLGDRDLDIEQAQVSATIAAVAARRKLPERAVVIAYATALQESKLYNVDVRRPRLGRHLPAARVPGLGEEEADHGPRLRHQQVLRRAGEGQGLPQDAAGRGRPGGAALGRR